MKKHRIQHLFSILFSLIALNICMAAFTQNCSAAQTNYRAAVFQNDKKTLQTNSIEQAWQEAAKLSRNANEDNIVKVVLYDDWIAKDGSFSASVSENGAIIVRENNSITLDLNGHIVSRDLKKPQHIGNLFTICTGASLTISDSAPATEHYGYSVHGGILTGGNSKDVSGCIEIRSGGKFTMNGGAICSCCSGECGGAIRMADGGKITLNDAGLYFNKDNYDGGGAIYCEDGTVNLTNIVFEGNTTSDDGGAIKLDDCTLNASNCIFRANHATGYGGSLYLDGSDSKVKLDGCVVTGCISEDDGGAAYVNDCEHVYLMNSIFSRNSANDQSGAIHVNCDNVVLDSTTVIENTAKNKGGAIFVNDLNDLGVQGRTIVRDNKLENGTDDNIVLEWTTKYSKAFIIDGGLYEGSEIHLHSDTFGTTKVANAVSTIQAQYFFADNGSIKQSDFTAVEERFVSSVIGTGNLLAIMAGLMISIIGVVILVAVRNRKQPKNTKKTVDPEKSAKPEVTVKQEQPSKPKEPDKPEKPMNPTKPNHTAKTNPSKKSSKKKKKGGKAHE